jgi:hypothetical protein
LRLVIALEASGLRGGRLDAVDEAEIALGSLAGISVSTFPKALEWTPVRNTRDTNRRGDRVLFNDIQKPLWTMLTIGAGVGANTINVPPGEKIGSISH